MSMNICDWCDEDFDPDDWIDIGEPQCRECGGEEFCSTKCLDEHNKETHDETEN